MRLNVIDFSNILQLQLLLVLVLSSIKVQCVHKAHEGSHCFNLEWQHLYIEAFLAF